MKRLHTERQKYTSEHDVKRGLTKRRVTDPRSLAPSSSSSRSEGGLVRGGQERVDTFRARIEAEEKENKQQFGQITPESELSYPTSLSVVQARAITTSAGITLTQLGHKSCSKSSNGESEYEV